jgi:hypothetical protein
MRGAVVALVLNAGVPENSDTQIIVRMAISTPMTTSFCKRSSMSASRSQIYRAIFVEY